MSVAFASTVFREKAPEAHFNVQLPPESSELLQARIKDLSLHLSGTPLDHFINQLYEELAAKGIDLRPQCYLSDQWGCPSGVPVIGIPFYLADAKLQQIENALGAGLEDEQDIMMYLRHEAGHAFNYAYRLYESEDWKRLFGDYAKPYIDSYKPKPFSRKYVVHIAGWYAQKHPDEDFAETFAVWLTPNSDWNERYRDWSALKKLQYVDTIAKELGKTPALVTLAEKDLEVDQMEETVLDHYRQRMLDEKIDTAIGDKLDQDLHTLFEAPNVGNTSCEALIRAERQALIHAVAQYSGVSHGIVTSLVDHVAERIATLNLTVHRDRASEYITKLSALLTALSMNFLFTDKFFEN